MIAPPRTAPILPDVDVIVREQRRADERYEQFQSYPQLVRSTADDVDGAREILSLTAIAIGYNADEGQADVAAIREYSEAAKSVTDAEVTLADESKRKRLADLGYRMPFIESPDPERQMRVAWFDLGAMSGEIPRLAMKLRDLIAESNLLIQEERGALNTQRESTAAMHRIKREHVRVFSGRERGVTTPELPAHERRISGSLGAKTDDELRELMNGADQQIKRIAALELNSRNAPPLVVRTVRDPLAAKTTRELETMVATGNFAQPDQRNRVIRLLSDRNWE